MSTKRRFNAFDTSDDEKPPPKKPVEIRPVIVEPTLNDLSNPAPDSLKDTEKLCSELPELSQCDTLSASTHAQGHELASTKKRSFLHRPQQVQRVRDALSKDHFCVLIHGLSGIGKTHLIEESLSKTCKFSFDDLCTEVHCDADDPRPVQSLLKLSLSSKSTLRKSTQVLIENIDGLDADDKKKLSAFVKDKSSQCRLIMTCDSLSESPGKTLKDTPGLVLVSLSAQSLEELQDIVLDFAAHTFGAHLKESQVEALCTASRGNPRSALLSFEWSYKTRAGKAKTDKSAKVDISRDLSMDLFSQVPQVLEGRPPRMHLESSDAFFCLLLLSENTSRYIVKDHLSCLEIVGSRFLVDLETTQTSMESLFKAYHDTTLTKMSRFLKMPGPSKKKPVELAAWWPKKEGTEAKETLNQGLEVMLRPSLEDSLDRLSMIRQLTKDLKSLTVKSPQQDPDPDIRELRRKSPFVH